MNRYNITETSDTGQIFITSIILIVSAMLVVSFLSDKTRYNRPKEINLIISSNCDIDKNNHKEDKKKHINKSIKNESNYYVDPSFYQQQQLSLNNVPVKIGDPIREFDYMRSFDPLEEPNKRVPRHWLPHTSFRNSINIPTRGMTDTYSQLGYLQNEDDPDNKLIRLFGREEFPGSHRWEYYTSLSSGNDSIKIPIESKKHELYDGDSTNINGKEYKVNIYKNEKLRYQPYIL